MIDRRLLSWGLFLILLGAIPLAVRQGLLAEATVARLWTLWPLLLVAAGLGLLLRRTSLEVLGSLLTAATLGLIGGGLIAAGPALPSVACGNEAGGIAFPAREGTLQSEARIRLELNCGELDLSAANGSTWRLDGSDESGRGPRIDASPSHLTIRSDDRDAGLNLLGRRDAWSMTMPTDPDLDLAVTLNAGRMTGRLAEASLGDARFELNAGELRLDLAGAEQLRRLELEMNAGTARVNLPELTFTGRFNLNAGTLDFCAPDGAGLRIRSSGALQSDNFADRGMTQSGNTWETAGFNDASVRIELEINANAGSLNLNPTGGCDA
jgi:hypothetical protein